MPPPGPTLALPTPSTDSQTPRHSTGTLLSLLLPTARAQLTTTLPGLGTPWLRPALMPGAAQALGEVNSRGWGQARPRQMLHPTITS